MNIKTIETQSFSMDYLRFGSGEETFVILPGLSVQGVLSFADAIAAMYKPFTEHFTVYLFERRKDVPAEYPIRAMARDTAEAMKLLGLKAACVYGASQGGMIAMELALKDPELVRKLALASTAARMTEGRARIIEKWIRLAREGKPEELYLSFGENVYPPDVFSGLRASFSGQAKTVTADELERFAVLAEGVRGFDILGELGKLACPTWVAASRDDRLFGDASACEIAAMVPGAELALYDGFGHAVYDTAPDFVERMLGFCLKETK